MSKPIQYNPRYPSIEDLRAKAKKEFPNSLLSIWTGMQRRH